MLPDTKSWELRGLFTDTNTPRRHGNYAVEWLRAASWEHGPRIVKEETSDKYPCSGIEGHDNGVRPDVEGKGK
jgi:hypothetical protein